MHSNEKVPATSTKWRLLAISSLWILAWGGCKVSDLTYTLRDNDGGASGGRQGGSAGIGSIILDGSPGADAQAGSEAAGQGGGAMGGRGSGGGSDGLGNGGAAGIEQGGDDRRLGGAGTSTGGNTTGGGAAGLAGAGGWQSANEGGSERGGSEVGSGGAPAGQGGAVHQGGSGVGGGPSGTGGAGQGGSGVGGNSSCPHGQVSASQVVIMGDTFYAKDPQLIETRVETRAQSAGALGPSEKYRGAAVNGQPMSSIAATQWEAVTAGGAVKVVIMDGGMIDCLASECPTCSGAFTTLLGKMASAGVGDVIYTRFPEPGNPPGSNATLKRNLDALMPNLQAICEQATSPRCHWVDLRGVWANGDTDDGLNPNSSGAEHVGDEIWTKMQRECIAQ